MMMMMLLLVDGCNHDYDYDYYLLKNTSGKRVKSSVKKIICALGKGIQARPKVVTGSRSITLLNLEEVGSFEEKKRAFAAAGDSDDEFICVYIVSFFLQRRKRERENDK